MAQDLNRIAAFVGRLVRRERAVLVGQVGLQVLVVFLLALFLALAAAALRWDRSGAAATLALLFGAGVWAAALVPMLRRWRSSGDPLRQARLVEKLDEELGGRLVTSVERVDGPQGQESPELLALVARRAAKRIERVDPGRVHSTRPLLWRSAVVFGLVGVNCLASILVPGGAGGAWQFWLGGLGADTAAAAVDLDGVGPRSRVGDIVLEYVYPEYTGLDPSTVPNSTGVIHAPPGTKVKISAKVGRQADAAALVAYDEPPLDAGLVERRLEGELTVQIDPGTWHFVVYRGGEPHPSDSFAIEPEPDLPPEVTLDEAADVLEVALDEPISLGWRALDDYGIRKVDIEIDGVAVGSPIARPETRKAELFDTRAFTPRDLGLQKGARVDLVVAAWDNDAWSGSKAGRSRAIELVILGERGLDQRQLKRESELIEAMITILADHLEEEFPPGRGDSGDYASWGEAVAERHGPLDDAIAEWGGIEILEGLSAQAARMVRRSARELVRYSQVAFTPGLKEAPLAQSAIELGDMRTGHIATLEQAILMLDQVVQGRLMQQLTQIAEELEGTAANLRDMAERGADPIEMHARLERLEEQLKRIAELSAALKRGPLKSFVNQRESEMSLLMQEIRDALARGDNEEAAELMARLAEQIEQLSQSIQDQMSQQAQEDEQVMEQARDVIEEMKKLEEEQAALQQQVSELREQGDEKGSEKAAELWEQLEKETAELTRRSEQYEAGLEKASRSLNEQERAGAATDESRRLEESASARDLSGASQGIRDIEEAWYRVGKSRELAERMARGNLQGPGGPEQRHIERQMREVDEIIRKLQELASQANPAVQRQAQKLEQQQDQLQERLEELSEQAEQVGQQMPIQPQGMSEALGEANQRMQSAGQELGQGRPMQAEGEQGMAGERVKDARRALEESLRQSQQIPGPGGGADPEQQEGGDQNGNNDNGGEGNERRGDNSVDIPSPEDFRTPEEYRRMLLEGMEGEVPEEYRALKKRYFEELVHQ
ncbi:MAG: DUF4175 family protein [Deltaproteobacteria bacterium]|nr:MAG: DUF4175 family protein [Deltaproteobacteria bacterium]